MQNKKNIFFLQVASVAIHWVFVVVIATWIFNLIKVAHKLSDAFDASLAISIVAIPVFVILAAILTYVFVGLQKGQKRKEIKLLENPDSEGFTKIDSI
ncbi:MAG: hypothetical protein ACE5HI_12780 [bacterium]